MPQYMLVCAYFNYYIQNPWSMSPEMGLTLLEDNNRPSYKHPSPSQWDFLHSGSGSAIGISPSQSPDNAAPQMGYKRTQLCSRDFPNSEELLARTVDGFHPLEDWAVLHPIITRTLLGQATGRHIKVEVNLRADIQL